MKRAISPAPPHVASATTVASCCIPSSTCTCSGELYLQKRPEWKDIQPGKWDTAVGGHVDLGESVEQALRREVREELGITDFTPQQVTHYVFESARERELVFTYKTVYDGPVTPSDELDGGRFWPVEEIRANLGKGVFTPNFEGEVEKVI